MSWVNDDELAVLRTEHRQYKQENEGLKDTVKRVGILALAALKLLRTANIPSRESLMEDTFFLMIQHCTGYKRVLAELLLDIKPVGYDNTLPKLPPPPKSEE